MEVKDRVAVITGGGRGLGRAIALTMSHEGARIVIMGRTGSSLDDTAGTIIRQGGECLPVKGDVSRERDVRSMVDQALERFSRIDILVNNGAVIGPARFLEDAEPPAWKKTLAVNLTGPYLCSREVVPIMGRQGAGKIINIASGLGQMPFPRFCAYAVSKAGLIQLTRSLSEELKPLNIQVNAIDPGVMDTGMQEAVRALGSGVLGDEIHRSFVSYKEDGGLRDPEAVAPLVVFLASFRSDGLTGRYGSMADYRRLGFNG
ncbi:MAG: SDR family oxidoreductase [Deltaproteobacteria bacterium]|nr:SDR family oxidoreductase [Deltaproteobacteria bacterium]